MSEAFQSYVMVVPACPGAPNEGFKTYTLVVNPCAGGMVLNASSFTSCFGSSFYFQLAASGGVAPYTYSLQGGGLPPSLLLSGDEILGVLTHAGTYDTVIRVVDNTSTTVDFPVTFIVGSALRLDVDGIFPVVPSAPYSQQLVITGMAPGAGIITLDSAQLPPGLTYNTGTNTISGTTTVQTGIYPIVSTLDSGTCTNTYNFNLLVYRLQVEPFALCVLPNVEYYARLSTLNGIAPFTWEVTGTALPDYLVLNALTGEITGSAATEAVVYSSVKVTDGLGNTASTDLTITVSTLCASNTQHRPGAPPTAPGRAAWIPSLQSALIIIGSNYFADNLIRYLPSMYGT